MGESVTTKYSGQNSQGTIVCHLFLTPIPVLFDWCVGMYTCSYLYLNLLSVLVSNTYTTGTTRTSNLYASFVARPIFHSVEIWEDLSHFFLLLLYNL